MARFYAVGVGAGGCITLGALRALEKADIIAAPVKKTGEKSTALEILKKEFDIYNKEVIETEFPMTRDNDVLRKARKVVAEKIISCLRKGKTVALITLGDVAVYSTASYVREHIRSAGFETETIAGVPSFCAAADKAGISLCEGDETVAIVTSDSLEKIEKCLNDFDTVVIMKAGKNSDKLYKLLEKHGLAGSAVVCGNIGMEGEVIERPGRGGYGYFTTVIVKKNIDKFRAS